MRELLIKNVRPVLPDRVLPITGVLLRDGKIAQIGCDGGSVPSVDGEGGYLLAGFVDLHVHGGGGADFMDATPEAFACAVKAHLAHGTTTLYPTAMTAPEDQLCDFINAYHAFAEQSEYAPLAPGLHLEGPYFSNANSGSRGAQSGSSMSAPDKEKTERLLAAGKGKILRWDAAPELPGVDVFARQMKENGIVCAVAHSDATADETERAYALGFSHVTHFYNATSSHRKRGQTVYGGVVEATYLNDSVTVELIGDGCHIPRHELLLALKIKGTDGVSVITDATRIAGTELKSARLGSLLHGTDVIVEDGVAKLPDRTCFAGSIATMDRCLRTLVQLFALPIEAASRLLSLSPAKRMGIDGKKGSIECGKDADLVIVSEDLSVKRVFVSGRMME